MPEIFVTTLKKSMVDHLKAGLIDQGFSFTAPKYTIFQAKRTGVTCTLYESLKLTVQGKGMKDFIEFFLEPEILKNTEYTYAKELACEAVDKRTRIGVDEAGKGDYFGPLCIAGVAADAETIPKLIKIGAKDSKTLSDDRIRKMAPEIRTAVPCHILVLRPKKYNELYTSFKNLNALLAWCHASVIEKLSSETGAKLAVIDKFAHEYVVANAVKKKKLAITLEQRVRGESDVVVAAASILARWAFVEYLAELEKKHRLVLPKGAGAHVTEAARKIVLEHGTDILEEIAKVHFKTTGYVT